MTPTPPNDAVAHGIADGLPAGAPGPAPRLRLVDRAGRGLLRAVTPTAVLLVAMWVLFLVSVVAGRWLLPGLGLIPRRLDGLDGVLFSPLLHTGWRHLIGNTSALLVLGPVAALVSGRPLALMAGAWLGSGLLTWVLGSPGVHVGASGIVYALIAFLLVYGLVARRVLAVAVSLGVAFLYLGSSLVGLLPQPGVSWTGHLAGALTGVGLALLWGRQDRSLRRHGVLSRPEAAR